MFGWLVKRQRKEHIKLVIQNRLCAQFLENEYINAVEAGLAQADPQGNPYTEIDFLCGELTFDLQSRHNLTAEHVQQMLELNRQLRTQYDQWLLGKRAAAIQFGQASTPLHPFDIAFQPNEGWKIFLNRFVSEFPLHQ